MFQCRGSLPISFCGTGVSTAPYLFLTRFQASKRNCGHVTFRGPTLWKKAKFVFVMHSNECVGPKLLFYIWYNAIYDNDCPGDVKISSKHCWPLTEGHITPNVEWFSVVRPYNTHEMFRIPIFVILWNIKKILSKMLQILTIQGIFRSAEIYVWS